MGKPVSSNVKRAEVKPLNTKINREVFEAFKDYVAHKGYSMNVMLETFMLQYTNGRFKLTEEEVLRWKNDDGEVDTLNTTFNKEISLNFKATCKGNGYFLRYVLTAFMYKLVNGNYILEYTEVSNE